MHEIHIVPNVVVLPVASRDMISCCSMETTRQCSVPIAQMSIKAECMPTNIQYRVKDRMRKSPDIFRHLKCSPRGIYEISGRFGGIFCRSNCAVTAEPQLLETENIEVRVSAIHCRDVKEADAASIFQRPGRFTASHDGRGSIAVEDREQKASGDWVTLKLKGLSFWVLAGLLLTTNSVGFGMNSGGQSSAGEILDWQKDVHFPGKATCPKCEKLLGYGTAGIANLEKQHLGTVGCEKERKKRDKQPTLKNGSMKAWLTTKVKKLVPSTLLDQLHANIELIPLTVPIADQTNPLSVLSGDPAAYVPERTPVDELWEQLSGRGTYGLDGALRFLDYFIAERGLEGGMVELKIEQLLEAVQSVTRVQKKTTPVPPTNDVRAQTIIDVDADVEMESVPINLPTPTQRALPAKASPPCTGFLFPFSSAGKTASSDYPYGLHDIITLPWTYESNVDDTLTLRSKACKKTGLNGRSNCRACAELPKQATLKGILDRSKDGVHENAQYGYHPISGLVQIIRRKNKRIEELRVRGLNAAKRLAVQARSLTDHKRFVRAIGSGKVENVDRVVRVQLGRKQGIRGLLSTYDKAAQGVYHPKSYTEEDDLRGVLLWKLAGNRVADFAHRALGLPSRTTLRKQTTVPPIVPSPGKPQASEVAQNVGACFEGITDVLATKKPKHAILMYDEIATERRVRWDPKTNNFLGVCRQHANKVSLQFNGEGDLEELFRAKEEGKVHFAGEATVAAIGMLSDETRLYAARPVMISGDCKKESGVEHLHNILNPTIDGVNLKRDLTGLRIVSLASDGETRRGKAFVEKTFVRKLSPDSNIYHLLKDIRLMNFLVGEDDLTGDKDYKHVFKRGRNRLLEHLSAAAHLLLILYRDGQKDALPTLLFTDIMIMIKNVYFCVAKAKVDDPTGNFWIILLGTDRLEELFGILRTMIGNNRNLDLLQLVERITGTTEIANIFALYPHWDRAPRRLQLPTMARDSTVLPDRADHIKPPSWRGDTCVANVTPLTCWNRGQRIIEEEFPSLASHFHALDEAYNVDILSPLGELIVNKDLDPDDNEDDDEDTEPSAKSSVSPDLEDAAADEEILTGEAPVFTSFITVDAKPLRKTRALALMQKLGYKAGSTDRLKRVADVQRYSSKSFDVAEHSGIIESDAPYILVSEPIATLVRCEEKLFVCIGEVADIRLDSKSIEKLSIDVLQERKVIVHFQILCLVPATTEDDPAEKRDWRSSGVLRNVLAIPGRLVLPVDPALSTRVAGKPYYLFESAALRAFGAQLLDEVTLDLNKHIPKFVPTSKFPYRESSGLACFVCEGDDEVQGLEESDSYMCSKCTPPFILDVARPQTVLTHMGAHILHDPRVDRYDQPCGFCGRPFPMCLFVLKKSHSAREGMTVNLAASKGCPNFVKKFNYAVAERSKDAKSPCSNVPLRCPECSSTDPAIWRYNLKYHLVRYHPLVPVQTHVALWQLSESELRWMRDIWEKSKEVHKKRNTKKIQPTLAISSAHSSRLALVVEQEELLPARDDSVSLTDDESFINDSPIASPELSDDEEAFVLRSPSPLTKVSEALERRSPSPLEYIPGSHVSSAPLVFPEPSASVYPGSNVQHDSTAIDDNNAGAKDNDADVANSIPSTSQIPPVSTSSLTTTVPVVADAGSRRSTRKRKERKGLSDLTTALSACFCGKSAAPMDDADCPNVARCKMEGCETKWYHLACIEQGSVPDNWMCEACLSTGEGRSGKRRRGRK
ncbi:hypothetical protein C8R44DRAFT_746366 [Mycena epipterygia]|nr:hypothetical protein C8R44DRAFT_746366 [Mycena epipterygia]